MGWMTSLLSHLVSPVTKLFQEKERRKQAKIIATAKIAEAHLKGNHTITLSDAEWEAISALKQDSSWKDEYVTLIITSPIVLLLLGSLWLAFTGDARLLNGVNQGIKALQALGVPMGLLMEAVVFAAIGLKLWRSR